MAGGRSEVDRRLPAAGLVERRDIRGADLQIERGGHAFLRREAIGRAVVHVRVQVDEPRRDDEAASVDEDRARQRLRGHGGDPAGGDPDVTYRVETRFRIDDASAPDYEIERRRLGGEHQRRRRGYAESAETVHAITWKDRRPIVADRGRRSCGAGASSPEASDGATTARGFRCTRPGSGTRPSSSAPP